MIILKGSNEMFGLPEASPYVTRTEVHLKMAGLHYEKQRAKPTESPKGQIPFIVDDGETIADSTFIRFHIEQEYGIDLDEGLSEEQRAVALGVEMLCDHQLIPAATYFRWMIPANFDKGPRRFFEDAPEAVREPLIAETRERVRAAFLARGVGRHSHEEIVVLFARGLHAVEAIMGDRPYLMGAAPCAADAILFAGLAAAMTPAFDTPVRDAAIGRPRLVAYVSRMMDRFYPDFAWDAGVLPPAPAESRAA